jgi:UPF0755 protein
MQPVAVQMLKKSKNASTRRVRVIVVVLAIVAACLAVFYISCVVSPLSPGTSARRLVTIPKGASLRSIAGILERREIVRSKYGFLFVAETSPSKIVLPGVYELSPGMTPREVMGALASGSFDMRSVTIPEGWTLQEIADLLEKHGIVNRADFLEVASNEGRSLTAPGGFVAPSDNLEGYLFPDTYRFSVHSDPHTVVRQMLANFERRVVDKHGSVEDWKRIVIVASLIEREAKIASDRPLIASVIYNRLHRGMRLQIDATVEYALPKHKARLHYKDLLLDSPYNTYRHAGLPPAPICCPGASCIDAALNPAHTTYLYYVAGSGGGHIFSGSLLEHDAIRAELKRKTLSGSF